MVLLVRHFIGDKVTNLDALTDFISKDKLIGELPFLSESSKNSDRYSSSIADELLNKTVYELTHSEDHSRSFTIVSSRKDAGKTEISTRLFNKLKEKHKVCLIDLDYRKKGLTKTLSKDSKFNNFEEFNASRENFIDSNGSLFVPSFEVDSPNDFFSSEEFKSGIKDLKEEFDYLICDTPPWDLFVDAKIISKLFDIKIYIVCNHLTSFKDIKLFMKDIDNHDSVKFFYNKFYLYFNFLWYKYQYPAYSRNYYYDYMSYSNERNNFTFRSFLVESPTKLYNYAIEWINSLRK